MFRGAEHQIPAFVFKLQRLPLQYLHGQFFLIKKKKWKERKSQHTVTQCEDLTSPCTWRKYNFISRVPYFSTCFHGNKAGNEGQAISLKFLSALMKVLQEECGRCVGNSIPLLMYNSWYYYYWQISFVFNGFLHCCCVWWPSLYRGVRKGYFGMTGLLPMILWGSYGRFYWAYLCIVQT